MALRKTLTRLALCLAIAASSTMFASQAVASQSDDAAETVSLVMNSGRVVQGELVEETADEYVVLVYFEGLAKPIRATYQKVDVLEITRGVDLNIETPAEPERNIERRNDGKPNLQDMEGVNEDTALLYMVNFEGDVGRGMSITPISELFKDVDRVFNDKVSVPDRDGGTKMVVREDRRDKNIVVMHLDADTAGAGFDGMWGVQKIEPVIQAEREAGRRIVWWVKRANGGASFLPFLTQEVYFESDGTLGGISDLDFFTLGGDKLVDEKQISLRLETATGYAIQGGYGQVAVELIRAMARPKYWFAVRMVGGKPEFLSLDRPPAEDDGPDWVILSAGAPQPRALNLNADWAYKLSISDDTADTLEDLVYAMGIQRNYKVAVPGEGRDARGTNIFTEWRDEVEAAVRRIVPNGGTLWRDYAEVERWEDDPIRILSKRIRILEQIRSVVSRYGEIIDDGGRFLRDIDLRIFQHKEELRLRREAARG